MLLAPRQFIGVLSLLTLLVLLGASVIPGGARAQAPTATLEVAATTTPAAAACPAPDSAAFAAPESSDSPYYDYAVLLDVSGSMLGWRGDPPTYFEELDIFDEVKESLKNYVSELQPGSMVYVIPFGNPVDSTRVGQFGIEQDAPDGGEAEALAYIDSIQADNDETHITASVGYALDMLDTLRDDDRQHIQTVLLYTDGIGNGLEDVNSENVFDPTNLVTTLREFRQEQPYLFVKYVSLGVEVPGRETLEQNGVEVVETVQGVPPVREVRLAVVPETLHPLTPGGSTGNLLCATSGDLGDGITVFVNDDPSQLPPDVQLAFRAGGSTLDTAGIPLTYTLANLPASGLGPFTTEIEVRPEDPTVFLVPSRLPVTFSVEPPVTPTPTPTATPTLVPPTATSTPTPVPPTATSTPTPVPPTPTPTPTPIPTAMLSFGGFTEQVVVRGMDTADLEWTQNVILAAGNGGRATLTIDRSQLDQTLPSAAFGFRTGDGSLGDEIELYGGQPRAELVLFAKQADLATFPNGGSELPAHVIVTPRETDLTIEGAEAEPNGDGTSTVSLPAPLSMLPQPTCTVEVGDPPGQAVTIGDASGEPVRWETVVDLDGSGGCRGEIVLDDGGLREKIPGAEAMFLVNDEERVELYLDDNRFRADLIVTASRDAVAGLGAGEREATVELIVTPERSVIEPPEGATENEDGTFTISVRVRVTVSDQPIVRCTLPSFDVQEVIRDGATEPALRFAGPVACDLSGGASVTLRVAEADPGVTASFESEGAEPSRTVTLAAGDVMPSLSLEVDRVETQRREVGNHVLAANIHVRPAPASAFLDVEGASPDANGGAKVLVEAPVRVVEPPPTPLIVMQPIELAPDPITIETRGTSPDPLEWRGEFVFDPQHGAQGTVAVNDGELPQGVAAFFEVGGIRLPSPVAMAGQQGPIELVVQGSLTAAQAMGAGERQWEVEVVLDPQGAEVRWTGAAREGNNYVAKANAGLLVTETPGVRLWTPVFTPRIESSVTQSDDDVPLSARVNYELGEGAAATLSIDNAKLAQSGATAELIVDGETVKEPVELNGQEIQLLVNMPREALTEEKTYDLAVDLVARTENAVIVAIDDAEIDPATEATLSPVAKVTYSIPSVTLDLGTWAPEVVEVPSTGTGAEPRRWERAIVVSEMEEGARPLITVGLEDGGDGSIVESTTLRLYQNEVAEENLVDEGPGGAPATVSIQPGQEQIIAVIEAPEDRLRALGIGDNHCFDATLTVDPNGAQVAYVGESAQLDEPASQECAIRAKVFQPFDPWPYIRIVLGGLGLLLAAAAAYFLLPAVPRGAAVTFDGNPPVPIARGSTVGGGGHPVDVGASGYVGQFKGQWLGRITKGIKFVTAQPVTYNGNTPVEAGKSIVMNQGDRIEPDEGSEFRYG